MEERALKRINEEFNEGTLRGVWAGESALIKTREGGKDLEEY